MKKFARKKCWKMFLEAIFFCIRENFFQSFRTKFLSLLYMISLAYKISHCLSGNHNPELRYVMYTGVTLFAPVLHLFALVLSPGQTGRQVVASGRKLNLRRDLRWVAKRFASFFASTRKSRKKRHFKADYPLFYWLMIG